MKTSFKAKAALIGIVALVGLLFLVTSCEQPTDTSQTRINTLAKLDSPKNLRVREVTGAFIISWDPVLNADEYEVLRRNPSGNAWVSLGSVRSATGTGNTNGASSYGGPAGRDLSFYNTVYIDKVGYNNALLNRQTYRYMVVAKKNNFSAAQAEYAMRESKAEAGSKRSTIPEVGAYELPLPAASAVKFNPFVDFDGNDKLEVWWESSWDDIPVYYNVEYKHSDNPGFNYIIDIENLDVTADYTYSKRAIFPLLGGSATVRVTAYWQNDSDYYRARSQDYEYTGTLKVLPWPAAYPDPTAVYSGATALVTWESVPGATGYEVYRRQLDTSDNELGALTRVNSAQIRDNTDWYLYDTPSQTASSVAYYIVAINADARSPYPKGIATAFSINPAFATPTLTVDGPYRYANINDSNHPISVAISWDTEADVAYTLYRAPISTWYDAGTTSYHPETVGAPTLLTTVSGYNGTNLSNGRANYVDTVGAATNPLELYQAYRYTVVATKAGRTVSADSDLMDTPFNEYIDTIRVSGGSLYQIAVSTPSVNAFFEDSATITMDIKYALSGGDNATPEPIVIGPWKAMPNGTGVHPAGTAIPFAPSVNYAGNTREGEDVYRQYIFAVDNIQYRASATSAAKTLKLRDNARSGSWFVTQPDFSSLGIGTWTANWGAAADTVVVYTWASTTGGSPIEGARIYRSAATGVTGLPTIDRATGVYVSTMSYHPATAGANLSVSGTTYTVPPGTFYFTVAKAGLAPADPGAGTTTWNYYLGILEAPTATTGVDYADLSAFHTMSATTAAGGAVTWN